MRFNLIKKSLKLQYNIQVFRSDNDHVLSGSIFAFEHLPKNTLSSSKSLSFKTMIPMKAMTTSPNHRIEEVLKTRQLLNLRFYNQLLIVPWNEMNHFQSNRLFDRVELHFFVLSLVCACLDKVFILTNEPCDCHICLIKKKIFFFFFPNSSFILFPFWSSLSISPKH